MKAKKEYGQNFLSDQNILESIVDFADIQEGDHVFEIGPGKGALTEVLLSRGARVTALEIDAELFPILREKFKANTSLQLIEGDILSMEQDFFESVKSAKVVANIPYYITAPIIKSLLTKGKFFESITLLVQKEVALRLAPLGQDRSVITIMAQYYADATLGPIITKNYFDPIPKIDSAVVKLIPKRDFESSFDKQFFRFVKMGFAARRKTLLNNLVSGQLVDKKEGEILLEKLGFSLRARPQELTVEDWLVLCAALKPL